MIFNTKYNDAQPVKYTAQKPAKPESKGTAFEEQQLSSNTAKVLHKLKNRDFFISKAKKLEDLEKYQVGRISKD